MLFELIEQRSDFFFPPSSSTKCCLISSTTVLVIVLSLSLSVSKQANSVFLGALPHQGQLTLYKSEPKNKKTWEMERWGDASEEDREDYS